MPVDRAAPVSYAAPAVHGSWWPLVVAAATAVLLLGVLFPPLAAIGLAGLLASVVAWIREDLRHQGHGAAALRSDRWWAVVVLILGEVVLFGTLFTYYFWARGFGFPLPDGSPLSPLPQYDLAFVGLLSAFLFTSAYTAHQAESALKAGDTGRFTRYLAGTVLLGFAFVAGQAYEYSHMESAPTDGTYATAFYALTGVHGLHVFAGAAVLASLLGLSRRGRFGAAQLGGFRAAVLYWHFVDLVWVFILFVVYLRWI